MKILALTTLIVILTGCAATFQPSGQCIDGTSYILSTTGNNPTGLDKTLLAVNFAALEKGTYTPEQALVFLDKVAAKAKTNITYIDLANYLITETDDIRRYLGVSFILLGDKVTEIAMAGGDSLVSECDVQLILAHINHQKMILALY